MLSNGWEWTFLPCFTSYEKAFSLSLLSRREITCRLRGFFSIPCFLRVFIKNVVEFCQINLFCIYWYNHVIFLHWWVILIQIVNQPWISRICLTWSWCVVLICWILLTSVKNLCICTHQGYWSVVFLWRLSGFGIRMILASSNELFPFLISGRHCIELVFIC